MSRFMELVEEISKDLKSVSGAIEDADIQKPCPACGY